MVYINTTAVNNSFPLFSHRRHYRFGWIVVFVILSSVISIRAKRLGVSTMYSLWLCPISTVTVGHMTDNISIVSRLYKTHTTVTPLLQYRLTVIQYGISTYTEFILRITCKASAMNWFLFSSNAKRLMPQRYIDTQSTIIETY